MRFQSFFLTLMFFAAVSAYVLPERMTNPARAQVQGIFSPVAYPAHRLALWARAKWAPAVIKDDGAVMGINRTASELNEENQRLRVDLAQMKSQLDMLKELNADRAQLGQVRELCAPASVVGTDSGARDSLNLSCSSTSGIRVDQAVLYSGGMVGRISRAGVTGATARLITDRGMRLTGRFGSFRKRPDDKLEFIHIAGLAPLVEGKGNGKMSVLNITLKQASESGLTVGDWVVLDDKDWPAPLQGRRVGKVTEINQRATAPLHADITVEPDRNLELLRDVMVMIKE